MERRDVTRATLQTGAIGEGAGLTRETFLSLPVGFLCRLSDVGHSNVCNDYIKLFCLEYIDVT
jgi:hypothetical protein